MAEEPLISIAAAAREIGLNKSTLSRQVKSGAIRSHDGMVRLSEVYEDRVKNIDATIWSNRTKKGAAQTDAPLHATVGGDDLRKVKIDGVVLDINAAKALKETYLGRLAQLKFEQESAGLVQRDAVHKAVFDLFRRNRDSWTNWTAQVSPMMAAALGVDQVKLAVVMEEYVRQQLAEHSQSALRIPGL
jgi:hypothetical protein